jgi:hypothetical protein
MLLVMVLGSISVSITFQNHNRDGHISCALRLPGSYYLEPYGVTHSNRVIGGRGGKTKAGMEIKLLMGRRFVSESEIDGVLRAPSLRKIS